ncbi:glycoside hydrolase family 16 protein [Lentinus tigrinus ALCF2SS1-7]|uniref:Glycoside hydrolase family 16 protein n=1 Tax=Lentinus tigrinus ALCF2SS1-6 TaxID=1328759 RepID=A0A5C2RXQ6_9APHY|nr:glycoside hydrolase family 16 protein [Lentinus tigrinus ALCF2SS1-6]RPD82486.1 glycoside hydrolase family 16 protein [Lentinus tigrinus ALCF2SS1-7]
MNSSTNLLAPQPERKGLPPPPPYARGPQPRFLRAQSSHSSLASVNDSSHPSISDKYVLPLDADYTDGPEADDKLHNPDPARDRKSDKGGSIVTGRGLMNLGCIFILAAGIVALFGGYPVITYFTKPKLTTMGGFNFGGINASGQVPEIPGNWGLVDKDTPEEVKWKEDYVTGQKWQLIFSDEFNTEGRTFYPGDDPYWEAVDLHYWATGNKEWYDPEAITTRNGSLEITLSDKPNHGLDYTGGMMQTWNKFCFTGGLVETSVMLPGFNNIRGLWPAIWAMGNLGRAGYGASLDGMWPYTYDACDVGTAPNQTLNGLPVAALSDNDDGHDGALSYQPGQRLSRCTCPGESHPGPAHENGEYVGRSAPEIDMFEAQIGGVPGGGEVGAVSQSGQWAPYNYQYTWLNTTDNLILGDDTKSKLNSYKGGVYQQATSVVTKTNQEAYEFSGAQYSVYGFQYKPGFGDAYISWITDGQLAWTLHQAGMGPDPISEISDRPVPQEPMYLIMNLGISENFGFVDYKNLVFPSTLRVDWIRVYQDPNNINIGCDPDGFPTKSYIETYKEAYANPNLTTWVDDYKQTIPKNKFLGEC